MITCRTSGWGNYPVVTCERSTARSRESLIRYAQNSGHILPQGNCRSYGDACISSSIVSTLALDRLLSFDPDTGLLRAEAGLTLEKIIRFAIPQGWFLPVTPGTKHPTIGGCVAADIHGKNHHLDGSLSQFIDALEIVLVDGSVVCCSRTQEPKLFWATLGGMGLTGFVYAITLRLRKISSAFLQTRSIKTQNLAETCQVLIDTQNDYTYSVAWLDCLSRHWGRGLVALGNHTTPDDIPEDPFPLHSTARFNLPMPLPRALVSRPVTSLFNHFYYRKQWHRQVDDKTHYDRFFYPLDFVNNWNRVYGNRGFLQYQLAVPFTEAERIITHFVTVLRKNGNGSTLAVLKTFGKKYGGPLSFPLQGFTLALDIPFGDGKVIAVLQNLTSSLLEAGGRVYLAKDAVVLKEHFRKMYPRVEEFQQIKELYDPECRLRSIQSDRLGLT